MAKYLDKRLKVLGLESKAKANKDKKAAKKVKEKDLTDNKLRELTIEMLKDYGYIE